jgi:ABC-2 type transport system permease protein
MRPVTVVAAKELRQRIRDKSALVLGFLAPLAISALISAAFHTSLTFHAKVGLVDLDHGAVAAAFTQTLGGPQLHDVISVRTYPDQAAVSAAVDHGTVQAAVIIPAGFSAAVQGTGTPPALAVLGAADNGLAAQIVQSVAGSFTAQVNADRLSVQTALRAGAAPADIAGLVTRATSLTLPEGITQLPLGGREISPISYYAPGMGIFFVLFAVSFGARGYFVEQREGTLDRIAAAPVGRSTVLAGKAAATFVYALASLATTMTVSALFFGADWGGVVPVAALCLAMAAAVVALTALVITLARTERQAEGAASIVVFALALLGGNFVFVSASPPGLRRLALFTPNGWAMRGFTDLASGLRGAGTVAGPVAAILAFTLATAALTAGVARLRRLT